MKSPLSGILRPLLAIPWVRAWRRRLGWQWFRGSYPDWATARAASVGYDDAVVLARVKAAVREVQAGRAAWERDGTTFNEPATNEPLLAALQEAARESGGNLSVVDFGGSLGSTWWQHRHAFANAPTVRWRVVEQAHYVRAGAEFEGPQLSFHQSIDAAVVGQRPDVILLSGVLPYLEQPLELVDEISRRGFRHVIIDRTPLVREGGARLTVQHTPPGLGGGSYPCWLLAREPLLASLRADYSLVREWPAIDDLSPDVVHRGFHFRRKQA